MIHKYRIGQTVEDRSESKPDRSSEVYVITAELPRRDGEFEYRITRTVRESDLKGK
jgi:hypothetical protein